jgi:aspartate beta-hydroxylase
MASSASSITAGFELLAAGRYSEALTSFQSGRPQPAERVAALIGMTLCARELDMQPLRVQAVAELLTLDGRGMWSNLLNGELLAEARDYAAALSFLMNAVRMAEQQAGLPPLLAREVERARAYCELSSRQLSEKISSALPASADDPALALFNQSLDILFGRKQIYLQSPRYYYYPGLPQRQFFPVSMFDWVPALEARTANIRSEALALLSESGTFKPYLQSDPSRPRKDQDGMTDNPDWSACYLIRNGSVVSEVAERCPETMAAIREIPLCSLPKRSPSVLFSLLRPGAHIPPHCGLVNTRLICHLPVVTPPGCQLRVGNETFEWRDGKVWVFDDSIEHEAWNRSQETRIILLFEVWRPELNEQERAAITALFNAMDGAENSAPAWEI